jgi:lipid-A-disaccharide synthase
LIGLSGVLRAYLKFRKLFHELFNLALQRKPDFIICVDFSGFNRRFAHAIKQYVRAHQGWFQGWNPKIIQYVSPQVWASRAGRARQMERDYDLLLSIFPFEKDWYAQHAPRLRVVFVGNPIVDRYPNAESDIRVPSNESSAGFQPAVSPISNRLGVQNGTPAGMLTTPAGLKPAIEQVGNLRYDPDQHRSGPTLLLLPGSRVAELTRHLPVMLGALSIMRARIPTMRGRVIVPSEALVEQAKRLGVPNDVPVQAGGLPEALAQADIAIAKTGTISTECAWFGVPTVTLYKTSWANYQIGKRIVKVKSLTMPNLLANEEVFPEFIQDAATPENISRAALDLLQDESRRIRIKARLAEIMATLGSPGASQRVARAILGLG